MCGALLRSDYYEASVPPDGHQPATCLPFTGLDARQVGRPRVVPTFTTNRSKSEVPTSTPAASPRLRRRPSPWPPHRTPLAGFGVDPPPASLRCRVVGSRAAPRPISVRFEPGGTVTGLRTVVPCVHLLLTLAGPGPSDSADPSRTLSGPLATLPSVPRVGLPSASPGSCDRPAAGSFHPCSISSRLVAHRV